MFVCVCDSESVCTNPLSVTCNRRKTRTNIHQHVTHGKLGLTIIKVDRLNTQKALGPYNGPYLQYIIYCFSDIQNSASHFKIKDDFTEKIMCYRNFCVRLVMMAYFVTCLLLVYYHANHENVAQIATAFLDIKFYCDLLA